METGSTLHLVLMIVLTPISVGAMLLVTRWFIRQQSSDESQTGRIDEIWGHRERWGEALCRRLINREVAEEMTPEMVSLAWGKPTTVQSVSATEERWIYQVGDSSPAKQSVTFREGRLTAATTNQLPVADSGLDPWLVIAILISLALMLCLITLVVIFVVR